MASCDEIPKNAGSNVSMELRNPPWLQSVSSREVGAAHSLAFHRDIFVTRFYPSFRFCQNTSRDSDSAKRPLIPMIAIGPAVMLMKSDFCSVPGSPAGFFCAQSWAEFSPLEGASPLFGQWICSRCLVICVSQEFEMYWLS